MPKYAQQTEVSSDKSKAEIERTLVRWGADSFAYGWEGSVVVIGFRMRNRQIRYRLPLPARDADEIVLTPSKQWERTERQQEQAYEQAIRQRWRALLLVIKAKLEAVEAGITTFDDEFLSGMVLPGGSTVGQWTKPQLDDIYASAKMPSLLPGMKALPSGSR